MLTFSLLPGVWQKWWSLCVSHMRYRKNRLCHWNKKYFFVRLSAYRICDTQHLCPKLCVSYMRYVAYISPMHFGNIPRVGQIDSSDSGDLNEKKICPEIQIFRTFVIFHFVQNTVYHICDTQSIGIIGAQYFDHFQLFILFK